MTNFTIRVVIISGNTFVRLGLRRTCEAHPGVMVVGECLGGAFARDLIEQERPNLIVLDMELDKPEVDVIGMLRESAPRTPIVLLTGWADMERGRQAMEVGADVIMMKCQPPSILLAIIENITKHHGRLKSGTPSLVGLPQSGHKATDKPVSVYANTESLTERERAVVALVGQGLSNRSIAERLCISETTVRHHLTSIFGKLGVSNRQKLLILAHQCGLTELKESA